MPAQTASPSRRFELLETSRRGELELRLDLATRRRGDRAGESLNLNDDGPPLGVMRAGARQWIEKTPCALFMDPPVRFAAILTAVGFRTVLALTLAGEVRA